MDCCGYGHAVDPDMTPGGGEASSVASHIVAVNEAEIELGFRVQLQSAKWCKKGIVGARFRHRQVEELDRPPYTSRDRIGHLDHDPGVLRLDNVLVGRAAVAQVVAELDRRRDTITDRDQFGDRLLPEIDRPRLVVALPGNDLLAHVPLQRDAVVRQSLSDRRDLAEHVRRQHRDQRRPVGRDHVVVGRRNRGRE